MIKVTAAIIEKDGKILIARRKKGHHLEGRWEFPGGKIEPGETPEECLKRELKEEFGIETEVEEFVCSSKFEYSHIAIELLAYKVRFISGKFILTDHDQIRWISPNELQNYDFADADIPIVKKLLKDIIKTKII